MTAQQLDIFDALPSAPIEGEAKAVVESVAEDWQAQRDWNLFVLACEAVAPIFGPDRGVVHVGAVRRWLTKNGELVIYPRRLSAFWSKAASKAGFLDAAGWEVNDDHAGKNAGRPQRVYRLRSTR